MRFKTFRELAIKPAQNDPLWHILVPLFRNLALPLSFTYYHLGITPFVATLIGFIIGLFGMYLTATSLASPIFLLVGLLCWQMAPLHDYVDGQIARVRIHQKQQSFTTQRVGAFADLWLFAIINQALTAVVIAYIAQQLSGYQYLLPLGLVTALILMASYQVDFAKIAYWPQRHNHILTASAHSQLGETKGVVKKLHKTFFYIYENNLLTTHNHAMLILTVFAIIPVILHQVYVTLWLIGMASAFLLGIIVNLRRFDEVQHE